MAYSGLENVGIFGIKHCGMLSFVNNVTKNEDLYCDYANSSEFSISGETVDALGQGTAYVSWDKPKEGTGTLNLQISSMEMMALANGSTLENKQQQFYNREEFTLSTGTDKLTLKDTPLEGSVKVYKLASDKVTKISKPGLGGTLGVDNKKEVTIAGGTKGDVVVVAYLTQKTGLTFAIKSLNEKMTNYTIYMRAQVKTKAEGQYAWAQLTFPNVMVTAENNFNFDAENPTDFTLNLRILPDANGDMVKWSLVPDTV